MKNDSQVDMSKPLGDRFHSSVWNPGRKYEKYLSWILSNLGDEKRTVRDVYYALESRGFPDELASEGEGWDFDYRYVKRAVKRGRRAGFIDPSLIVDTSRSADNVAEESRPQPEAWVRQIENHARNGYYRNFWEDQSKYVEVWLEKASLSSVFAPICDNLNVRLEATRGDWSDSKVYEATHRLREKLSDGRDVRIVYFGDYNPSGLHAPVAVQNTMGYYGLDLPFRNTGGNDPHYFDIWPQSRALQYGSGSIKFERVALTTEQVENYDLPSNPTPSSTDKDRDLRERFREHTGTTANIELNALKEFHREELEGMLRGAIDKHIDATAREAHEEKVEEKQETVRDAVDFDYSVF